ncbi:MAG: hypothetical protein IJA46_06740 [Bacteroidaceae bacterium]|nr:hypothetical protein [Bacteroidaceae bacterium]
MYGKIAPVRLELGGEVNSNVTGIPLCRTMCGGNGNECVRLCVGGRRLPQGARDLPLSLFSIPVLKATDVA